MPFKSKAQRRKFAELLVKGEISEETFEEWNRETGKAKLPERVQPKPRAKVKTKTKTKTKTKAKARTKAKTKAGSRRPK
jgi:hypothetical protein